VSGCELYILDFSFDTDVLERYIKTTQRLILLDHHQSAFDKLRAYPQCYFDMNRSGAGIAWDYFFKNQPRPEFINYVEDSDLFRFQYPKTHTFILGMRANPRSFALNDRYEREPDLIATTAQEGEAIEKFYKKEVDYLISTLAKPCTLFGKTGKIVNATRTFSSEIGAALARAPDNEAKWAIVWHMKSDHVACSIRSAPGVDVSAIAKHFGGGGHPEASAFRFKTLKEMQDALHLE